MIELIASGIFNLVRAVGLIAIWGLMLGTVAYWAVAAYLAHKERKAQKSTN